MKQELRFLDLEFIRAIFIGLRLDPARIPVAKNIAAHMERPNIHSHPGRWKYDEG